MFFWKLFFENQKVGAHIEEVVVIGFFFLPLYERQLFGFQKNNFLNIRNTG
jgi:hypothetical protein